MISPTHVSVYNILFHFCFFLSPRKKAQIQGGEEEKTPGCEGGAPIW